VRRGDGFVGWGAIPVAGRPVGWRPSADASQRRASKGGVTEGLFHDYGPAQRHPARRGYAPEGRGVYRAQRPLQNGEVVTMDDDLIPWLTKDLWADSGDSTSALRA
jgi:hypothetical protein